MLENQINIIIGSAELSIRQRVDSKDLWEATFNKLFYKPVAYSNGSLDYQFAYQCGHGGMWQDISLIIYWNNKPAGLWPLSISVKDNQAKLTSQGFPILPPLFVPECPSISRKSIIKSCLNIANEIAIAAKQDLWESGEFFDDSVGMSDWHIQSMERDALCNVHHELYRDLRPDIIEIKKTFRKGYKSRIIQGSRLWAVGVLDSYANESVWQEFRDLHFKAAGRVTRSDETWALQLQDIECQRALLIWLRDSSGTMVGGGFFNFTSDEGVYAVAAYDRTLFDKPLGHVVQYRAIEELKRRGVRWYKIGARPFRSELPPPTDKEVAIGVFKQGSASHFFPHYHLTHKVEYDETT